QVGGRARWTLGSNGGAVVVSGPGGPGRPGRRGLLRFTRRGRRLTGRLIRHRLAGNGLAGGLVLVSGGRSRLFLACGSSAAGQQQGPGNDRNDGNAAEDAQFALPGERPGAVGQGGWSGTRRRSQRDCHGTRLLAATVPGGTGLHGSPSAAVSLIGLVPLNHGS